MAEGDLGPVIVFGGLSLSAEDAHADATRRGVSDADIRGPLRAGELDPIDPPATVVIIDGVLDPAERLGISEARRALQRGVTLYGASSTGALLALELDAEGMHGVGDVVEFLRGYIRAQARHDQRDPAELVTVLFAEPDHLPLTVPLIDALLWLHDHGVDQASLFRLADRLCRIEVYDRDWDTIMDAVRVYAVEHRWSQTIHAWLDAAGTEDASIATEGSVPDRSDLALGFYKARDARAVIAVACAARGAQAQ